LRNVANFQPSMSHLRDVLSLAFLAALLSTAVSASCGTTSLWLTGNLHPGTYSFTWLAWWLGDMLGAIIVAPFILVWCCPPFRSWKTLRNHSLEATILFSCLCITILCIFEVWRIPEFTKVSKIYFVFPWLIWSAIRFGQPGATTSVMIISAGAITATLIGRGQFAIEPASLGLLHLQTFLAIVALTGFALAAVSTERKEAIQGLRISRASLEQEVLNRTSQLLHTNEELQIESQKRLDLALENQKLMEEAQTAVRTREEILAIVSHDLKNPLSSIFLTASLLGRLLNSLAPEKKAQARRLIATIEGSIRQMRRLISDLLDFTRIRAGTFSLQKQEHLVEPLMEEFVEAILPLCQEKQIHLQLLPHANSRLFWLICDKDRVFQILSNLVGNAIKFSPEGATITIETEYQGDSLKVSVTDNGPGIPKDQLDFVFERFWQAKNTAQAGSGLGLYITRGIVEAHGGKIWVESAQGRGTTFRFTLPDYHMASERGVG